MAYIEWWNRTGPITMGERFGLNEISTRAKTLSPTKSYTEDRIDMKPGGIVEPGVTHYGKAHVDDPLYNIKAGDDLGKGITQNLQWNRPKTKKTISGYTGVRSREGERFTRRDFNLVKKFWETLKKPERVIKPWVNTWEAVKDLHKFEDYLNEDKTWTRTKFKKPPEINETWWNKLSGTRRANLINKYKDNYLPRMGTTGAAEISKLLGFESQGTLSSMISMSKKDPNLFAAGSEEYAAIMRAQKLLKQLKDIGIVPKYVAGPKSKGTAPENIFSALNDEQKKGLKKIKDERALLQKEYEMRRPKRVAISSASKKTLTQEATKLNTTRVNLLKNMNAKIKQMGNTQLKNFIKRNPVLLEMVETTMGLKGKPEKTSIDTMSPNKIRDNIHFEGDHIKTFKEAKWDPVTKKVLTGLDIENPGNLRLSIRLINNSFKKRALNLFQTTVDTKDFEIIKNKKLIENFFKRTGQALSLETGEIIGKLGDIELSTQLKHLLKDQEFINLLQTAKNAKGPPRIRAMQIIGTLIGSGAALTLFNKFGITPVKADTDKKTLEPSDKKQEAGISAGDVGKGALATGVGYGVTHPKQAWELAKKVGSGVEKVIRPLFVPGVDLGAALVDTPITSKEHHRDATSPLFWMTKAFWANAMDKYGITRTLSMLKNAPDFPEKGRIVRDFVLRAGINPAAVRFISSKIAWPATAAASVYDAYEDYQERKEFLTPERIAEAQKEEFDKEEPMFAMGGIASLMK